MGQCVIASRKRSDLLSKQHKTPNSVTQIPAVYLYHTRQQAQSSSKIIEDSDDSIPLTESFTSWTCVKNNNNNNNKLFQQYV